MNTQNAAAHAAEMSRLADAFEVCASITYDRRNCDALMKQTATALRAGIQALNSHASLVADNKRLRDALQGLVNVCTHPLSTKAEMRTIAEEARPLLAQDKPI